MTPADEHAGFKECFGRLVLALKMRSDERTGKVIQAKYSVYFEALQDLPLMAVAAATQVLQRTGSGFFPSTTEWHTIAQDIAHKALVETPTPQLTAGADGTAWDRAKSAKAVAVESWRQMAEEKPALKPYARIIEVLPCRDPDANPDRPYCELCEDSGLRPFEDDAGIQRVRHCSCRQHNAVIQRRWSLMGLKNHHTGRVA